MSSFDDRWRTQVDRYRQAVASLDTVVTDESKRAAFAECDRAWHEVEVLLAEREATRSSYG